jgi:chromosome segregation ATPase
MENSSPAGQSTDITGAGSDLDAAGSVKSSAQSTRGGGFLTPGPAEAWSGFSSPSHADLLQSAKGVRQQMRGFGGVKTMMKQLIDDREKAVVENEKLKSEISKLKFEHVTFKSNNNEATVQCDNMRSELSAVKRQITNLEEDLSRSERSESILKSQHLTLQDDLDRSQEENMNTKRQIESLQNSLDTTKSELARARNDHEAISVEATSHKYENNRLLSETESLKQTLSQLKEDHGRLNIQAEQSEEKRKELYLDVQKAQADNSSLVERQYKQDAERAEVESSLSKLVQELEGIRRSHEREKKDKEVAQSVITRTRSELDAVSSEFESCQAKLTETLSALRVERQQRLHAEEMANTVVESCDHKIASMTRELSMSQDSLTKLRQEFEYAQLQSEAVNHDYRSLQESNEHLNADLRETRSRLKRVEAEANEMAQSGERRWKRMLMEVKSERDKLMRENAELRDKVPDLEAGNRKFSRELVSSNAKTKELELMIERLESQILMLNEKIKSLQTGLRQAIGTAKDSTSKRQKFENAYRAKLLECRNFEEKLRLANLQNVSKDATLKSTKHMLSEAQKEVDDGRTELLQWREIAMKAKDDARREERQVKETNSALMLELNEIRQNFQTFLSLSKNVAKEAVPVPGLGM